ncbi:MAG: Gfo/Idh/MocA family oxidoreductase [Planctomycetes bacterium]|nr:Gfo/Idh/MocA family oxidoreductase [Planctomycetota bacterium]
MNRKPDDQRTLSRRSFLAAGAASAAAAGTGWSALAGPPAPLAAGPGDPVRAGLIGVGGRGTRHLETALKNNYVSIAAVCDLDEGRLNHAAGLVEAAGGRKPALHTDYRKLLEDPSIEAVFSATPCVAHYRIYMDCIAAGKHLYGEKPMCISVKEADDIVSQQEKHPQVKVQIGFQRRCNPRTMEGIKLIREDKVLGPLVEGRAAFNNAWGGKFGLGGPGSWQSRVLESGDWMVEQAVHSWDVINWVAGATPRQAFGLGNRELFRSNDPGRDVSDFYCAILEYPGNFIVQFSHSWISPNDPAFSGHHERFIGLLGGIDLTAGKITYSDRSDRKDKTQLVQPEIEDETTLAINSFIDCIRHDRIPHSTVYNGRDATLVGLLVRKAVYERRAVTWEEMLKSS